MSLGQVNRGYNVLGLATAARMAPIPPPALAPLEPKLEIAWGAFHQGFFSSLRALFQEPFNVKKFLGGEYFRDCWVERRIPRRAVVAAALWHVVFLVSPLSLLNTVVRHNSAFENTQLTWSGPIEDFPTLEIAAAKPKPEPTTPTDAEKARPPVGADAFHPRQRIVTDPVRPNHPRQTLINPKAPDIAPKMLPDLPNIVQLQAAAAPARPRIQISAEALAKLHPRARRAATVKDAALPDAPTFEQKPAEITLAASTSGPARPKLDLSAGATPRVAERAQTGDSPAPELSPAQTSSGNANSLIALSASPAPPKQEVVVPEGNLAARVSISPEGKKPGVPNGSPNSTADPADSARASSPSNAAGKSPVGISISGGNPQPKNPVSGLGNPVPKISVSSSRSLTARPDASSDSAQGRSGPPNFAALPPGARPEQVFASRRVYTLAVNMANLNSASGSWILHFAELGSGPSATPAIPADLSMPVPMRKVDPKYPPDLIEQNVQGEVILYGIIRADGSVDSIQVVRSVDPQLDTNAKSAFAQWKFTPAAKAGTPVDVEVIAHIPFKIRDDR